MMFDRYVGVDYSGAKTPTSSLRGLRVYSVGRSEPPREELPPPSRRKYWTRRGVVEWLLAQLSGGAPTLVGIDHAFSFPMQYFDAHRLLHNWPAFLDDFHQHWPTEGDNTRVQSVRDGVVGNGKSRLGDPSWLRMTESRTETAKSVFRFGVQGEVAKSTHSGLPWLRHIRQQASNRIHFWPFDGWEIPKGQSVIVEVYPRLWSRDFAKEDRTADQHDAYSVARKMRDMDCGGGLAQLFNPLLGPDERKKAEIEGWILGIA